jgi:predicted HTH transcriptional regulator
MIEITSLGLFPPSIGYSAMESRQSDARNKIIAPVFKRLGVIDQWGNGLKLIADELKDYPQIDFRWKEVGLSFQVQFVKLDFVAGQELRVELRAELQQEQQVLQQGLRQNQQELKAELRAELGAELRAELSQELKKTTLYSSILMQLLTREMTKQELANALLLEKISGYMNRTVSKLINQKLIDRTIPDNPTHPAQKFKLTERGKIFLELLAHEK